MNLRFFEPKEKAGLVVVFTGDGKGKTTAALGIAVRAAGHEMKVCIVQFIKGDMYSGEVDGVKKLKPGIELHIMGKGFCRATESSAIFHEHRLKAQEAVSLAKEKLMSGRFDILILDEINNAIQLKLVDIGQVLELIDIKPPLMHLILTGRDAHPEIIKRADTVTEMKEIKHAYHKHTEPQKGIDY